MVRGCLGRVEFSAHDHGFTDLASATETVRLLWICVWRKRGQQSLEFLVEQPGNEFRRVLGRVPLLVQHFLAANVGARKPLAFAKDAIDRLMAYDWPGNIRELRNLVERMQILHEGSDVHAADLPPELSRARPSAVAENETDPVLVPLADVERRHVERVLNATGWNKARAARVLDVDVKTLNKKIRDFSLEKRS